MKREENYRGKKDLNSFFPKNFEREKKQEEAESEREIYSPL